MLKNKKVEKMQEVLAESEAIIENAQKGLANSKSWFYAALVATIVTFFVGKYLYPIGYGVSAIAAGNCVGGLVFIRSFKRAIKNEGVIVSRCNTALKLYSLQSKSDSEASVGNPLKYFPYSFHCF